MNTKCNESTEKIKLTQVVQSIVNVNKIHTWVIL